MSCIDVSPICGGLALDVGELVSKYLLNVLP
jgi:Zn-finger nucleic acid-binding protein